MTLAAAARLCPYEVLDLVGAGGMGEVYRARDPRLGRDGLSPGGEELELVAFGRVVPRLVVLDDDADVARAQAFGRKVPIKTARP